MSYRTWLVLNIVLLLAGCLMLSADEIEIVSLSPAPPASLEGISRPLPGMALPPTTLSNSVTVVVRYRTDGRATVVNVYPDVPEGPAMRFSLVPPTGSVPPCGRISGTSEGECAAAFALMCDESTPSEVVIDRVGASIGYGDVALAVDFESPAHYIFHCPAEPPRYSNDCIVIGAAGHPGETPLPFGREVPLCRCLRDEGAREFRCAILHPDFFIIRRIPFPLLAGEQFSEVWEFLPLTELDSPVRVSLSGGGLIKPVQLKFGSAKKHEPHVLEQFIVKGVAPKDVVQAPGLARFEYDMKDTSNDFLLRFGADRTIEKTMIKSK